MKKLSFLYIAVILFLCGCATYETFHTNQKQLALTSLKELEKSKPSEAICDLGVFIAKENLVITTISPHARIAGFSFGDQIKAIEGESLSSYEDFKKKKSLKRAGDIIRVTVKRNQLTKEIQVKCLDGREFNQNAIDIAAAASRGEWDECMLLSDKYEKVWGPAEYFMNVRVSCNEAKRSQEKRSMPDLNDAQLIYELNRRMMVEATYAPERRESIRSEVLKAISWLESNRFYSFVNDLKAQWKSAIHQDELQPEPEGGISTSFGTGFIVSPDGLVLTAFHVVDKAKTIKVKMNDGKSFEADIVSSSKSTDLVILRINTPTPNYLTLLPVKEIKVGEHIFSIGYPLQELLGKEPKFTDGTISALSGMGGEAAFFQISVPVQPGNSGGPVVNDEGQVVGIVTSTAAIRPFFAYSGTLPQNINWAVKSDYAILLFNNPEPLPKASNRDSAIQRVKRALCAIEVTSSN